MDRSWGFQEVEDPRFQDSRHVNVVRFVSPTRRPRLTPGNIPGAHFRYSLIRPQGHSTADKYEGWNFNSGNYLFTTDTK